MPGSWWSSSSSCTSSFGSLDDDDVCVIKSDPVGAAAAAAVAAEGRSVKFLCSYGGRILPRHTDGTLRYVGGDNRVLSVHRPLRFHELQRKLRELCGWEAHLRCQLPTEDLDALVAVTCDDDLANLVQEYDEAASKGRRQSLKIRAFLFPRTPPELAASSIPIQCSSPPRSAHLHRRNTFPAATARASLMTQSQQSHNYDRSLGKERPHPHRFLVQNGRHWQ